MMSNLRNMPAAGFVVIVIIALLFILAVVLLFHVNLRYRILTGKAGGNTEVSKGFKGALLTEYTDAYKKYGRDVNTPAIISDVVSTKLPGLLLCERFLNNAVSLFVTLGLFGTFLGLSLSVASLTELLGVSNTADWLSVMDSVGGGLLSALSGMGVAFYTSLVGAGCSIVLTILRTVLNPQAKREKMETRMELWLDTEVAPTLYTEAAKDDADLVRNMINALEATVDEIKGSLDSATEGYTRATEKAAASMERTMGESKTALEGFNRTVDTFNAGVHDFTEVDYNLRGSVERMDLAVRDLSAALREVHRRMEGARQ